MKILQKLTFFLLLGLCLVPCFGDTYNDWRMVPPGHWIYDAVVCLAAETHQTTLINSAPLSTGEILVNLKEIEYETLSPAGKKQYRMIQSYIDKSFFAAGSEILSIGTAPTANLAGFFKTSAETDWIYNYTKRAPLFEIPVYIQAAKFGFIECDFFIGQNYWTQTLNGTYCNIPLSADSFDMNLPNTAYASFGASNDNGAFFNVSAGLGSQEIGNTRLGSVVISDHMTGAAYAKVSLFTPRLRYSFDVNEVNVDKYLYMHRLEGRPVTWLTLGVFEGVLVSQPLELRFMNPIGMYHGFAAWRDYKQNGESSDDSNVSSLLGVTFDISPLRYTNLYGQFMMNQWQPPYETKNWESAASVPNAYALLGGLSANIPCGDGYLFIGGEAVYTSPYCYLAADEAWSLYRTRKALVAPSGYVAKGIYEWIGSPFGPDTVAAEVATGYSVPGKWKASCTYRFTAKGAMEKYFFENLDSWGDTFDTITYEEAHQTSPTGTVEYSHTVYVSGEYLVNHWLTVGGLTGFNIIDNIGNNAGNSSVSYEMAFYVSADICSFFQN